MIETERGMLGKPTDSDTGEKIGHYEWNGVLYCHDERELFDWQTGEVECPHCGGEFTVAEAEDNA